MKLHNLLLFPVRRIVSICSWKSLFCRQRINILHEEKYDLCINREGAHPLWPLSRKGSDPIKLAHDKPVCQQSWSQGRLLRRTRRFFPCGGRNHRLYSLHRAMEGWPGWVRLENTGIVDPPKVVTNPGTNRARRSLTSLMRSTPLSLRQTGHQHLTARI